MIYIKIPFIRPTKAFRDTLIYKGYKPLCISKDGQKWILYDGNHRPECNEFKQIHIPIIKALGLVLIVSD